MEVSEIKQEVRSIFDPLAKHFNLSGPVELSLETTSFSLGYSNQNIGLEIEVAMSDFFIFALVYRPAGNDIPIGYNDGNGARQKLYLQQALKELRIDVTKETQFLQKLRGDYKNCSEMAGILAGLLNQYWLQISSNPKRWFL